MFDDWSPVPTGGDVLSFLGWPADPTTEAQAAVHAHHAAVAAKAYTRGRGWLDAGNCRPDIAEAIRSAGARSLSNPGQDRRVEAGSYNSAPGSFAGFSLIEFLVLNGYRKRAA